MIVGLLLGMTNCIAMNDSINQAEITTDYVKRYQKFALKICNAFTGKEHELLCKLSEVFPQKENNERYKLVAQCLKEILDYRHQSEKKLTFLTLSGHLLDFDNTFHLDFDENHPLVKDFIEKLDVLTMDGPE